MPVPMPVRATAAGTLLLLSGCSDPAGPGAGPIDELPRPLTANEQLVIDRSNTFGVDLMREVLAVDSQPNVVISPLSAAFALGMTMNGASGSTFDGMRNALALGGLTKDQINGSFEALIELLVDLDPAVEVAIANSTWANEDYPFHQTFFDAVVEHFAAEAGTRDFSDAQTLDDINGWVDDRTNGLIDRILENLDPNLALLLLNALYFDAPWTTRFDPSETMPASFTREDGTQVSVQMMRMPEPENILYGGANGVTAVELTYGGGAYSMVVAVPAGGSRARDVVSSMDSADWDALVASLGERDLSHLAIPRFTTAYDAYLNDPLSALGMSQAFTSQADFSELSPVPLCIDFVRQKTFIEVDEAGTRAAAVTAVGVGATSAPPAFVVDRPFFFAIRERLSGTMLFVGLIGDPTRQEPEPLESPGPCANR